jgi:hypothetical protein
VEFVENARKVTKWLIVCSLESSLPLHAPNLRLLQTVGRFADHDHMSAPCIKVSRPSPYHWITHGMFSIHLIKLTMHLGRFHVFFIQETDYRPYFICGRILLFLEHCEHIVRCIDAVRLSWNCVRAFTKDQYILHAWAPLWPQRCSGNICKRNLFCGYASHHIYTN